MTLPNFFILGAGRCGTTSLYEMLDQHPDIFVSHPKEPAFFTAPSRTIANPIDYADLFAGAAEPRRGEASHAYLSDPRAAGALHAYFPRARFVAIFRDPVSRALSLYGWNVAAGHEYASSFERALGAEERRFRSGRFARTCPQYFWNFMYYRSGLYGQQVARYLDLFDRSQFLFLSLAELKQSPVASIRRIHEFLGIEPMDVSPQHLNSLPGVRSPAAQVALKNVTRGPLRGARNAAMRLNRGGKATMRPETRKALTRRFGPDQELFHQLTGLEI